MRQRPLGTCRLCKKEATLCDSHLLPAAAYRVLRAPSLANPNPVHVGRAKAFTSSQQVKDYLLCDDCEQRFDKNGEKWVLSHCSQSEHSFPLRETLLATQPVHRDPNLTLYEAAGIPGIDTEKLIYFALSVYWRAAVHTWRDVGGETPIAITLGPFEEPLRLFLLTEAPFPLGMALLARVSGLTTLIGMLTSPETRKQNGYHAHHFFIPGIEFILLVGSHIPSHEANVSLSPAPGRFIGASPQRDRYVADHLSRRVNSTPAVRVKR